MNHVQRGLGGPEFWYKPICEAYGATTLRNTTTVFSLNSRVLPLDQTLGLASSSANATLPEPNLRFKKRAASHGKEIDKGGPLRDQFTLLFVDIPSFPSKNSTLFGWGRMDAAAKYHIMWFKCFFWRGQKLERNGRFSAYGLQCTAGKENKQLFE